MKGGAPINVALKHENDRRSVSITSSNGGAFLRGLGIVATAVGGELEILAAIDGAVEDHPIRGRLRMVNFRVVDAPTLAKILTAGSLSGVAEILGEQGIKFVKFQAPFKRVKGQIRIQGARAIGPTVGITMDGVIDLNRREVAMGGTLVPTYTINSVLGAIPILGPLLTGGRGGGVFGLTYKVTGPVSKPKITVYPLSALTPGILREILFGIPRPYKDIEDAPFDRE